MMTSGTRAVSDKSDKRPSAFLVGDIDYAIPDIIRLRALDACGLRNCFQRSSRCDPEITIKSDYVLNSLSNATLSVLSQGTSISERPICP